MGIPVVLGHLHSLKLRLNFVVDRELELVLIGVLAVNWNEKYKSYSLQIKWSIQNL